MLYEHDIYAAFSLSHSSRERVLVVCLRPRSLFKNSTACPGLCSWRVRGGLNLANDITNQSREFYRGGSSTLLTREQTINKYRPKSVAVLVSLI